MLSNDDGNAFFLKEARWRGAGGQTRQARPTLALASLSYYIDCCALAFAREG